MIITNVTRGMNTPHCSMCGAGNVALTSILLERNPATYSYWWECRACGYSSPGRLSREEAENDVQWIALSAA